MLVIKSIPIAFGMVLFCIWNKPSVFQVHIEAINLLICNLLSSIKAMKTLLSAFLPSKKITGSIFLALIISAGLVASCDVSRSDTSRGTLNVRLTDAPATYEAVYIDIQEVQLNIGSAQQEEWQTISTQSIRPDLLKLNNGADSLIGTAELETGTYNQLRFILGTNNEVIIDGESRVLTVPGGEQTGYKVNLNAGISEDLSTTKVIDFDVARSIAVTGNGQYILNPVLKVFDPGQTGRISGQLVPQGIPALVSVKIGNEVISTTYAEADGAFLLNGLNANVYKLLIEPASQQYADTTLFEKEVSIGEETDIGIIQLPESR